MSSDIIDQLASLKASEINAFVATLSSEEQTAYLAPFFEWARWARDPQLAPGGVWSTWLVNAGRGWGKTRVGAEWVRERVLHGARRIALVGRTTGDVRDIMIEGESGLLACSPPWDRPHYTPSLRKVTWPNGATAFVYTGEEPDDLRGPAHDTAWADEMASWKYPDTWDQLQFGLRMGTDPRCIVTTTPRPTKLMRDLMSDPTTVTTGGSTYENAAHLARPFLRRILGKYEGTALGEQEIHARLLDQAEGALWKRETIDAHRIKRPLVTNEAGEEVLDVESLGLTHIVIPIDPAVSTRESSSETGIVPVGAKFILQEGVRIPHFYVLDDVTGRYSPFEWATAAIGAYRALQADILVGEVNNGGDLVASNVASVDVNVPFDDVHASRGKRTRAEPISSEYEQGRVHHVGTFRDLEDQLCTWEPHKGHVSPDRLDSVVWGISYLKSELGYELGAGDDADINIGGHGLDSPSYWRNEEQLDG